MTRVVCGSLLWIPHSDVTLHLRCHRRQRDRAERRGWVLAERQADVRDSIMNPPNSCTEVLTSSCVTVFGGGDFIEVIKLK